MRNSRIFYTGLRNGDSSANNDWSALFEVGDCSYVIWCIQLLFLFPSQLCIQPANHWEHISFQNEKGLKHEFNTPLKLSSKNVNIKARWPKMSHWECCTVEVSSAGKTFNRGWKGKGKSSLESDDLPSLNISAPSLKHCEIIAIYIREHSIIPRIKKWEHLGRFTFKTLHDHI